MPRLRGILGWVGALAVGVALGTPARAWAQPYRGAGSSAPDAKDKSPTAARQRALDRARRAALEAALGELGKPSKSARKAVLAASDGWTGAYRVLSERNDAGTVAIEVEVEIDVARLRKRLDSTPPAATQPLFSLAAVELDEACAPESTARARIEDELVVAGAVGKSGAALRVQATCHALGAVPHTFEHAARIELSASADGRVVARAEHDGFAKSGDEAMVAAAADAAAALGAQLALHRRGHVSLRVGGGRPAVKLRRLERALVQSVMGVTGVELSRVDAGGRVVYSIHGIADASALAQALQTLQSPGVHTSVTAVEGPDVLAIELH